MDYVAEIKNFLDSEGRVVSWPTKRKKKIACLFYIAQYIRPNYVYSQKEFKQLINTWHTFNDFCMLRRELYDYRFVDRNDNGEYWLEETQPTPTSLGIEE